MEKKDFLKLIDDLLELSPGTLCGSEFLKAIGWDSLAVIGFMALCDEQFALQVSPLEIKDCETPEDLFALVQNSFADASGGAK
jgi:acyl carrier protein